MCGIAGVLKFDGVVTSADILAVGQMMDNQIHRGPDDEGSYHDSRIVLGHRRLSIIDLSGSAKQPMCNENGKIWIVYNGEIYNYKQLQKELMDEGHQFKSNSDTEVIIHGYEEWGIEKLLHKLRGMFAFAIYDLRDTSCGPQLVVARDRLGIKPLYYFNNNNHFVFASEIKAILASGLVPRENDLEAIGSFLLKGSIAAPKTINKHISSLESGHYLLIRQNKVKKTHYYDLTHAFLDESLKNISEEDAVELVRACLVDTIKCHLVSDVPVGTFLSGGIDSSSIIALMRQVEHKTIKTVSIVVPDTPYDESAYARIMASKYATDHCEVEIKGQDLVSHMETILSSMDQPTIDGINTYFVSQAAVRHGLKVSMSGVGGDEIFFGYSSFNDVPKLNKLLNSLALIPFGKRAARSFLNNCRNSRAVKLNSIISNASNLAEIYSIYRGVFTEEQIQEIVAPHFIDEIKKQAFGSIYPQNYLKIRDELDQVGFLETTSYMANQLLRDTDVFSMTHYLEVRVPFVDHLLVELLAKLPAKLKAKKDLPKRLLVKAMGDSLPDDIVKRRKMGFTLPFDLWLRNELKDYVREKLNGSSFFDKLQITKLLNAFDNRDVHWSRVWSCVVLEHWLA